MELGFGQKYKASASVVSLAVNGGTGYDFLQIAPANNVPLALTRLIMTSNAVSAVVLPLVLTRRSTASTGGTALVPVNTSPAGPAASCAVTYNNVTTTGAASGTPLDSQEWNEFAPYQYDVNPSADLIVPGTWCGLYVPTPPGVALPVSFTLEFTEIK
jgi:hypothetical protein